MGNSLGRIGGFGMGMTGSGLGGSFNDDLGGGSAFGGMEED
jgi:hypothetical protein